MPDITSAEQITWQRQAHALLGRLLELAAKDSLPAVTWTVVPAGAGLAAACQGYPVSDRRGDFTAWRGVLAGLASTPGTDRETTTAAGETRLVAQWERVPVRPGHPERVYPTVRVTLAASIWPDDDEEG